MIRLGCQTYSWQMTYEKHNDSLDHIATVAAQAGFAGIEPEVCMLGRYRNNPMGLKTMLDSKGLTLAAITMALPWQNATETDDERAEADYAIDFLQHFPNTMFVLCQLPGKNRDNLLARQENAVACINTVARRANARGLACTFHPNSPTGSIFRTEEDYVFLLGRLDTEFVGFCPDAGHIVKGGMDLYQTLKRYKHMINHMHYKNITHTGQWSAIDGGVISAKELVSWLGENGYIGWLVSEDESEYARENPDAAAVLTGRTMSSTP